MIHHYLNPDPTSDDSSAWGVAINSTHESVLVQLNDEHGEQIRLRLKPSVARDMAREMFRVADQIGQENQS